MIKLASGRSAWLWLLLEPAFHIAFLMFMFSIVRLRTIGGIDTALWVLVGLLTFYMFKRPATQGEKAINTSQSLFVYRRIKPVDCILARAALEGFVMILVAVILFLGAGMLGLAVMPTDPVMLVSAGFGMWLVGLGFALVTAVGSGLIPELGKILGLAQGPLYFFSGVVFPVAAVPSPYREWLILNPLVHGLEAARYAASSYYYAAPETSVLYLYECAFVLICIGLALQRHFAKRLVAE